MNYGVAVPTFVYLIGCVKVMMSLCCIIGSDDAQKVHSGKTVLQTQHVISVSTEAVSVQEPHSHKHIGGNRSHSNRVRLLVCRIKFIMLRQSA